VDSLIVHHNPFAPKLAAPDADSRNLKFCLNPLDMALSSMSSHRPRNVRVMTRWLSRMPSFQFSVPVQSIIAFFYSYHEIYVLDKRYVSWYKSKRKGDFALANSKNSLLQEFAPTIA
jgi:hypothetical protein